MVFGGDEAGIRLFAEPVTRVVDGSHVRFAEYADLASCQRGFSQAVIRELGDGCE